MMVNNYHYRRGGAETVMLGEIAELSTAGHEVHSFSAQHEANEPAVLQHHFPNVPDHNTKDWAARVRQYPRFVSNGAVRAAFCNALAEVRPDVIHFHNVYGRLTPAVIDAARKCGIPSVYTAHDYKLICPTYLRLREGLPCDACSYRTYWPSFMGACHQHGRTHSILYGLEASINTWLGRYDSLEAVLCPSIFMMESLAAAGFPACKLRHVPNFLPDHTGSESPCDGEYVLYMGRLSHEKGVATLLEAMRGVNYPLLIAGSGPEEGALRMLAGRRNQNVTFLGHCGADQVKAITARSLFVVVPSEWYENQPMVILEAFAAGKAVIAARIGGIPELVLPGQTGLLFEPGNAAALRQKLEWCLQHPYEIMQMGVRGRALVREQFGRATHTMRLLSVYGEFVR